MKSYIFIMLLLVTGCLTPMRITEDKDQILRAIERERFLGITEGPKLSLQEDSSKELALNGRKKEMIGYFLEAKGVCAGERYDLYMIGLDERMGYLGEYVVNQDLELMEIRNQTPLKEVVLHFSGQMFGEVVSFALVNKASHVISALTISPNPIEAKWEHGGYASVTALGPEMYNFCLRCTGFDPHETVHYTLKCCGDVKEQNYPVESDGSLTIILIPNNREMEGGICRIILKRSSGERMLKIPFGVYAKKEKF